MRYALLLFALTLLLALAACDSGGTKPDDKPPTMISVTVIPELDGETVPDALLTDDKSGDSLGTGQTTLTREKDYGLTVRASKPGLFSQTELVVFDEDKTEPIALKTRPPDSVTVTYEIRAADGDSLLAGTIEVRPYGPTLADAPARGSLRLKYDDSYSNYPYRLYYLESTYFRETYSAPFAPTEDSRQTVAVERKQVDVNADVDPGRGHLTVIEPDGVILDQLPQNEGDLNAELPKRAGRRLIRATARGRYPDSTLVAADRPAEVAFALEAKPECSDGIDNDGDGHVDATDGGCIDSDGDFSIKDGVFVHYEPEDDNEVLRGFQRSIGKGFPDTLKVASAAGEQEVLWTDIGSALPSSVRVAVGEITTALETKRTTDQSEEAFAVRLETGDDRSHDNLPYSNTSEIVADDNEQDGYALTQFHGVTRAWFPDGRYFNVYVRHACGIAEKRGDLACDGDDDVVLDTPPEQFRSLVIRYFFEPEERAALSRQTAGKSTAAKLGTTVETRGDTRVETTVRRVGDVKASQSDGW